MMTFFGFALEPTRPSRAKPASAARVNLRRCSSDSPILPTGCVLAQDEARTLRHNYIGTEHILLGLLREDNAAARAPGSFDVTLEEVHAQVARIVGLGDEVVTGQIPFTPRAKKVLELSLREALNNGRPTSGRNTSCSGSFAKGRA